MCKAWEGFTAGAWQSRIDVRDFIQKNYTPYGGDEAFLAPATPRTQALMHKLQGLMKLEQEFGGVLDVDTQTVSSLLNYKPGYLDKDNELIVGLQTDRPLKRGVNPFGGIRMAREACRAYGYELSGQVEQEFAIPHHPQRRRIPRVQRADPCGPALRPDHRACRTHMAGAGSSAITAAWRSTGRTD